MNPDGTAKRELYGSGSMWPNAMFDAQPLPGNGNIQFVAIVSGHHGIARSGRMITFDPKKSRKRAEGVMQEFPRSKETVMAIIKDNEDKAGQFLVGMNGRLYLIDNDFQVAQPRDKFAACGCGDSYALAAMRVMEIMDYGAPPEHRVKDALAVAEYFSAGVRGPFKILEQ